MGRPIAAALAPREIPCGEDAIRAFAEVVRERFGLARAARSPDALLHRLREAMHLAEAGEDPASFVRRLARAEEDSPLFRAAADVIPNHETCFFRDAAQLRGLVREILPSLTLPPGEPLRLLSAGCSSGEEAYSLAMLVLDDLHLLWGRPARITGFDVSGRAVEVARSGRYPAQATRRAGLGPEGWEGRFLRREGDFWAVRELVRSMTSFERANLMAPASLSRLGTFDAIVCRNVLIYFDGPALRRAVDALAGCLRPGGVLLFGLPESGLVQSPLLAPRRQGDLSWLIRQEEAA